MTTQKIGREEKVAAVIRQLNEVARQLGYHPSMLNLVELRHDGDELTVACRTIDGRFDVVVTTVPFVGPSIRSNITGK